MDRVWKCPPPEGAFTPLHFTTAGRSAKLDAPPVKHADLIERIKKHGLGTGPVKVVNCNFGRICQPGYEHKVKEGAKSQPIAPAGHKQRQPEGAGGCFGSAVEPTLKPPVGSLVYQKLLERGDRNRDRVYPGLYFSTTGSTTFSGSILPDYEDADWAIDEWVRFLNESQILGGPVKVKSRGLIMTNSNFRLRKWCERQVLNFSALRQLLLTRAHEYFPADITVPDSQMSLTSGNNDGIFRLKNPANPSRKNTVKLYHSTGKINFMGFPSPEFAKTIYAGLSRMFEDHWSSLVIMRPRPDVMSVATLNAENAGLLDASRAYITRFIDNLRGDMPAAILTGAKLLIEEAIAEIEEKEQYEVEKKELAPMMGEFAQFL